MAESSDSTATTIPSDSTTPSVPPTQHNQDIVADYPDELMAYKAEHGELPAGLEYERSVYCVWDKRTFIHTRATLPLTAIDEGAGFGLWVEIEPAEFERYGKAVNDDELYRTFETTGFLANAWPGFYQTYGLPVKVKTLRVDEKVYITDLTLDRVRDVLFETALFAAKSDPDMKEDILVLVNHWLGEGVQKDEEQTGTQPNTEALAAGERPIPDNMQTPPMTDPAESFPVESSAFELPTATEEVSNDHLTQLADQSENLPTHSAESQASASPQPGATQTVFDQSTQAPYNQSTQPES